MVEKANKRELILAAAREVFGEKGYHTATSEEIAKRAGVGKGTIYQYFDSKQAIFTETHLMYIKEYSENVTALIDETDSFEANMRRLVDFHIDNMQELSQYCMQMMSELHPPTMDEEEGKLLLEAFKQKLGLDQYRFITLAQERGEVADMDPDLIILCLLGMFIGVTRLIGSTPLDEANKTRLKAQLLQMALHGLLIKQQT